MSTPPGDSNISANDQNPDVPDDAKVDNSYKNRQGDQQPISVQGDDAPVAANNDVADPDSDQQLEKDEDLAIDKSNITKARTRSAKPTGQYQEPSDSQMGLAEDE